jgi:hypothetical protein
MRKALVIFGLVVVVLFVGLVIVGLNADGIVAWLNGVTTTANNS